MGRFANELGEGQGVRLAPNPYVEPEARDGFHALGYKVPMHRRAAAYEHCKEMGCTDKERVFSCIEAMCNCIERDDPHGAMERALGPAWGGHPEGVVDAIGVYRLLAVLLTAEKIQ